MERVRGIEPLRSAWKAEVLPLNYTRINLFSSKMVGTTRFEHATPWSQTRCSTKLSYVPIFTLVIKWRTLRDSNSRPFDS
jgi:hypothetical protein